MMFVALIATVLDGCSSHARHDTLVATFKTTNAARDAFLAWDKQHQAEIVANATSREDGEAKLAAYRVKQADIAVQFERFYIAIGDAFVADDDVTLKNVVNLSLAVKAATEAVTKGVP